MKESNSINENEVIKALLKVQTEIKNPKKDGMNPHFKSKYSTLDNVIDAYKDLCSENDLVVLENPVSQVLEGGKVLIGIEVKIMHSSGQSLHFQPYLLSPVKNDPQGVGSAITYARRYTLSSVFNIASEDDDDGNKASQRSDAKSNKQQTMMTQDEYMLLISKIEEYATLYNADSKELQAQSKVTKNMTRDNFIKVLNAVQKKIEEKRDE